VRCSRHAVSPLQTRDAPQMENSPSIPSGANRILDLGCGAALPTLDAKSARFLCGLDKDLGSLRRAKVPADTKLEFGRVQGRAEQLPFQEASFDCAISRVALPYMEIPRVLSELRRVLGPGGQLRISLHSFRYFRGEYLGHVRALSWKSLIYKIYVFVNGIFFHLTGKVFRFPLKRSRIESFQTRRGMSLALARTGFVDVKMSQEGKYFFLTARKG